jgi:hypothetical protein
MAGGIALALLALRAGVAVRRARRRGEGAISALRRRHLSLAKPAALLVLAGFLGGPLSMWLLRDRAPFATLHAALGVIAATLFVATALLGRRVEQGRLDAAALHGRLGLAALIAAGAATAAGFVLLP